MKICFKPECGDGATPRRPLYLEIQEYEARREAGFQDRFPGTQSGDEDWRGSRPKGGGDRDPSETISGV